MSLFLNSIFAVLALLSLALALWQWLAARRFPLHRRVAETSFAPAISLLKPLKGCDATTAESLQSWFNQNYSGQTQILFGVADANDPVCKIVQEIIAKNPKCDAQLVVCEKLAGANAKVAKLAQLEKLAKHELILVSDADVRVPPDFLANIVAPLRNEGRAGSPLPAATKPSNFGAHGVTRPTVGLVNCFYRLANPSTTAMRWEAVAINADFWSQVLQSQSLKPLDFALGAAILMRRNALAEIGGFQSLADCLADDYQLGHRIAKNGHRIALCPVVAECWNAPMNWRDVWKHQLRWARTIRVCQPLPYFFSILSNATLWPLLWLVSALFKWLPMAISSPPMDPFRHFETQMALLECMIFVIALLLARIVLAQNLQCRLTPERDLVSPLWLVPVKDLLQVAIWFCSFTGNTVEWRGRKMKLRRDGTLEEI
jgi:ceramide glucosyltransferase